MTGLVLVTFRQHRAQIVVTGALLAIVVTMLIVDRGRSMSFIQAQFAAECKKPNCADVITQVQQRFDVLGQVLPFVAIVPAAIGAFWGAPLLGREFETGTVELAWTQSVSRRRWYMVKVSALGVLVAAGGAVLGGVVSNWLSVFDGFNLPGTSEPDASFSAVRGAAPVSWWLFGFAVGVAGGAVLRRTIPAMVVTIALVLTVTIARNIWFGIATVGLSELQLDRLQSLEIAAIAAASVVVAVGTCRFIEFVRV